MKVFVARQPIIDCWHKAYGYEFLYRDSERNQFNVDIDGSLATRKLISNLVTEFGLEKMTGGKLAFLNFTEELLLSQYPTYLDKYQVIFEILETVQPSPVLLDRIEVLRSQGYRFAVDDYLGGANAFVEHADIIKVDFGDTTWAVRERIVTELGRDKCMLAEKVETKEDYERAKDMGYQLFQGYYFSKPVLMSKNAAQISSTVYWRVWNEVNKANPSFENLAKIIQLDVGLSYQFLSMPNTVNWYRGNVVTSLKQALVNMGMRELRRKVLLILMKDVLDKEDSEAAKQALTRALFASTLAVASGKQKLEEDAYVMGLFSMLDTVVDQDLEELLSELSISPQAKGALMGEPGYLSDLLHFMQSYELGDWPEVEKFISLYDIESRQVGEFYMKGVQYADLIFGAPEKAPGKT